ncbi:NAD(P)H-quinone oxidoreductase [Cellulomonas taurus]|uniref:NAD(P)H-quinone oxidoreductase n=1 Tax=Cellulomonas taurus TaxID=2729175 RepID=UPI00145CA299|nr:NAD(P)H-quinone oxidoreductase [Cellulomonas taurus]
MRVIEVEQPGGPEMLTVIERPDPVPGAGELLIRVAAAGVNRADLLQREGHYPPPPGVPSWPGLEVSGTVIGRGTGVDAAGWPDGLPVAALLGGGGYAEQVTVPVGQVLPVPAGVDLVAAGGLPEAVATAWTNLIDSGRLVAGETMLVQGGSGGVGSIAVQLATALGVRVLTTAGGPERADRCRELGADVVIDHRTQDVVAAVHEATEGRGVDVVLDVLGGGGLASNVEVLATGGRLVVIGTQRGATGTLDLMQLMAKRAYVTGSTLRWRTVEQKSRVIADVAAHAWPLIADGRVAPVVHTTLPLDQAAEAHRLMDSGAVFGKVLLTP